MLLSWDCWNMAGECLSYEDWQRTSSDFNRPFVLAPASQTWALSTENTELPPALILHPHQILAHQCPSCLPVNGETRQGQHRQGTQCRPGLTGSLRGKLKRGGQIPPEWPFAPCCGARLLVLVGSRSSAPAARYIIIPHSFAPRSREKSASALICSPFLGPRDTRGNAAIAISAFSC